MKKISLKKGLFVIILILTSIFLCSCMEVAWEKYTDISPSKIIEAADGNYVYAGSHAAIIKLGTDGTELWDTRIPNCSYVSDIINGSDNTLIASTSTDSVTTATGQDIRIIKLNQNGATIATYDIAQACNNRPREIRETSDGSFVILAGRSDSIDSPYIRYSYVIKTDATGTILWETDFGELMMYSMDISDDGTIIVGGAIIDDATYSQYSQQALMVKLDQNGSELWRQTYGKGSFLSVAATSDGGSVAAGSAASADAGSAYADGLVVKVSATGDVQWAKTFGDSRADVIKEINQTRDGGYAFAGKLSKPRSYLIQWNSQYWLVKLDASGEEQASKILGDNGEQWAVSVTETSDNGYIAAGYSQRPVGWINKFK